MAPLDGFRGAGGGPSGGGSSAQPQPSVRTPDNLRSKDTVEVILGLCQGRIRGLVDGAKSFYIGDTRLQNSDNTLNFSDFQLVTYDGRGIPDYNVAPALGGLASSSTVNVTLFSGTPVIRETEHGQIDFIDVRIPVQALYVQNDQGIFNNSVEFKIEYKAKSESVWKSIYESPTITISGKTTSTYAKEFRFPVARIDEPYEIRVTKLTAENTTTNFSTIAWESFQIIVQKTAKYPNTAVVQLVGQASDQFSSLPDFSGEYDLKIIRVPFNYNTTERKNSAWTRVGEVATFVIRNHGLANGQPITLVDSSDTDALDNGATTVTVVDVDTFTVPCEDDGATSGTVTIPRGTTGTWDGTFKMDWSNCGPWVLYDLVMDDEAGLNAYYPITLDKWDCYEAAAWCDTPVPDGRGGMRPRFTYNGLISDPRSGKEMARYVAGTFNGTFFDNQDGTAFLRIDKDDAAVHLFTPENIVGEFDYSFTDVNQRYNDILVSFTNPNLDWKEDRRRVNDQTDVDQNGRVTHEFVAVGCTNDSEAEYRARYKLLTSLTEKMSVSFTTNRQGLFAEPWEIALIADPKNGWGLTGRAKSLSNDRQTVYLRDKLYLESGVVYKLKTRVIADDGTDQIVEQVLATPGVSASVSQLTLAAPLPDLPYPDKWTFSLEQDGAGVGAPKPFRIIKVEEDEQNSELVRIEAMEINRDKWEILDSGIAITDPDYSYLTDPTIVPPADSVTLTEAFDSVRKQFQIVVSMQLPASYRWYNGEFEAWSRPTTGGAFVQRQVLYRDTIVDHPSGTYEFKILPKNYFGNTAPLDNAAIFTFEVENPIEPPNESAIISITPTPNGVQIVWAASTSLDGPTYEWRMGDDWDTGEVVIKDYAGTSYFFSLGTTEPVHLMMRVKDVFGNPSVGYTSITVQVSRPENVRNFVAVQQGDNVTWKWTPLAEEFIEYEIRAGSSWDLGLPVLRAAGNQATRLYPIPSTTTFWIKAVSTLGAYSIKATSFTVPIFAQANRNVVASLDLKALGWPGTKIGFVESIDNLLLPEGVAKGSYFYQHVLPKVYNARNWIDQAVSALAASETWDEAVYNWNSTAADIQWETAASLVGASFTTYIALYSGLPAGADDLISLNDTTTSTEGMTPSAESGTTYAPCYFANGFSMMPGRTLEYAKEIGPEFFVSFTFRLKEDLDASRSIITFEGEGIWLELLYDYDNTRFVLIDHLDNKVESVATVGVTDDIFVFGIGQSATTRSLYVAKPLESIFDEANAALTPAGTFDEISLDTLPLDWDDVPFEWEHAVFDEMTWETAVTAEGPSVVSGVYADVLFYTSAKSFTFFESDIAPLEIKQGYEEFREFIPGDYSYEKAIFRIDAENANPTTELEISEYRLNVDVPDIINRSTLFTDDTGAWTTVTFERPYNTLPELTPVVKTASAPPDFVEIDDLTLTGFKARVPARAGGGVYVAASVAWIAVGY